MQVFNELNIETPWPLAYALTIYTMDVRNNIGISWIHKQHSCLQDKTNR